MDAVERWLVEQDSKSIIAPERQKPFVGVQSPHFVDPEVADQTTLVEPETPDKKRKNAWRKAASDLYKKGMSTSDVSGDAPDCSQEINQFMSSNGLRPYTEDETQGVPGVLDNFIKKAMFRKEKGEHPELDDSVIMQIVEDHLRAGES